MTLENIEPNMVQSLISVGRALEKLDNLLEIDVFETLSKHNEYWSSEHEPEDEKLDQARRTLSMIQDKLHGIYYALKGDNYG